MAQKFETVTQNSKQKEADKIDIAIPAELSSKARITQTEFSNRLGCPAKSRA